MVGASGSGWPCGSWAVGEMAANREPTSRVTG